MSDPHRDEVEVIEPAQRDLLEHLQVVEQRMRERAATDKVHEDNEQLRATLAKNAVRLERNATIRFLALCVLVGMGLVAVLYLQVESRSSGQLRAGLIRQCELRNANTLALQGSLMAAAMNEDDLAVSSDLAAAARTLQTFDCRALH